MSSNAPTGAGQSGTRVQRARNPRSGVYDYEFSAAGRGAVAEAAARARAAQPGWAALGLEGRARALERLAQEIRARGTALKSALEADTGRRRLSAQEIDAVVFSLTAWPRRARRLCGGEWADGIGMPHVRHASRWSPFPLVGAISPWNFPLLLGLIDVVPALTAGCAVLLKPSEITPRFVAPLLAAARSVAELGGVFDVLTGDAATGEALIDEVDAVCFTGSVATGRRVAVHAAQRLIPAYLELGGKDPLVVLQGAAVGPAVEAALRGSVAATGQACQSIERIYVHRSLYDEFVERLAARASQVRLNWPRIDSGDIGPIIFERQAAVLAAQIADARSRGARVLCGGELENHGGGLWLRPTVLTQVNHDMAVMNEESFGPLMPVMPFDTVDQAVALANHGCFGLSAAVFAASIEAAEAVAVRLDAGAVSLNDAALTALFYEAPKQAFKSSGIGPSRMGDDGLLRFFRRRALIANTLAPAPLGDFAEDGGP